MLCVGNAWSIGVATAGAPEVDDLAPGDRESKVQAGEEEVEVVAAGWVTVTTTWLTAEEVDASVEEGTVMAREAAAQTFVRTAKSDKEDQLECSAEIRDRC